MKILVCCATSGELKAVKEEIKKLNLKTSLPITYLCTGIGNHETIFQLTKFLLEHSAEQFFIVNIGVCGYFYPERHTSNPPCPPLGKGVIQAATVEHLTIKKETIIPIFVQVAPLGKLVSSDRIVDTPELLPSILSDDPILYIDMESRGIELVAQHFLFPRLLLKVPVDRIGEETKQFDREKALELMKSQIDYAFLIQQLLKFLATYALPENNRK
jgi:nucleoside phosphorylase